jgi:hypothetical protein
MSTFGLPIKISDAVLARAEKIWRDMPRTLRGEDDERHYLSFLQLFGEILPRDRLEEMWVEDVLDLTWNSDRLRRLKIALLNVHAYLGLERILRPLIGPTDAVALANNWHSRDEAAIKQVDEVLASAELTMDAVMAETLALRLLEVERIDRMLADQLAGRSATLHEIERHRAAVARNLRRAVDQVEDAEFKVLDDASAGSKKVA